MVERVTLRDFLQKYIFTEEKQGSEEK